MSSLADDELYDPCCDRSNPIVLDYTRIGDASERIRDHVVETPTTRSRLSSVVNMDLYFKKEFMQFTGSFKDRGAIYALLNLTDDQRTRGVISTSAGNHAQALAYQGKKLNIPVTVVMPVQAPLVKVNSCRKLNANVILHGTHFNEARMFAMNYARQHGLFYINGYDHPDIIAGQGTVGVEIKRQVPDVDYVIVPIGGGGLVAGIAAAMHHISPSTKIIGVESDRCPGWTTAVENGGPVACEKTMKGAPNSITDGLSVVEVGVNAFATADPLLHKVITVSEDLVGLAILHLLEHEKAVVEGAGAAGFAAILSNKLPELQGKTVVCVLCGGNIDISTLGRVIDRALLMSRRLCRFACVISDRTGGLMKLLAIIATNGASVRDVIHDRMTLPAYVYKTAVVCTVETRDQHHEAELRNALSREYPNELSWKESKFDTGAAPSGKAT